MKRCVFHSIILLLLALPVSRAELPAGTDFDLLPRGPDADFFSALVENPPFTRSVNPEASLVLTGVAEIDGKPVVTVHDTEKNRRMVVSPSSNAEGWHLLELSPAQQPGGALAKIVIPGGETLTLRFNQEQLQPSKSAKSSKSAKTSSSQSKTDTRPPPSEEERRQFKDDVRRRMERLSEDQRRQAGEIMRQKTENNPGMSDRQKGELFIKVLDYVAGGEKR